jgi:hypothetical protein
MMKKQIILSIFILAIFFSGCTLTNSPEKPKKLSEDQRTLIYQKVLNEISYYKNYANKYYRKRYLKDAIFAYEKVNFYENKSVYSKKFLDRLHKRAEINGNHYYKKALKLIKKDRKKALYYLNKMMSNKAVKNGKELFTLLKTKPDVKKFLAKKENSVIKSLEKYDGTSKSLEILNKNLERLIVYDNQGSIAQKAKYKIKQEQSSLIENAQNLYESGNYIKAKESFSQLYKLYPKDKKVRSYLNKIYLSENLHKAKKSINLKDYKEAVKTAKKILKRFPKNKEAKDILAQANGARADDIPKLLKEAIRYYHNQELVKSQKIFDKILERDSKNNTALTYTKKIKQRLKTIKSLR